MSSSQGQAKHLYSLNVDGIKAAENELIIGNSAVLINYIYSHPEEFPDPAVRSGLAVKILLRARDKTFSQELLGPVIEDLSNLLSDEDHLSKFGDERDLRKNAISQELSMVYKCLELEDTISLNTLSRQVPSIFDEGEEEVEQEEENGNNS